MKNILLLYSLIISTSIFGQSLWQQHVAYDMDITLDHTTHQFDGTQSLVYHNASPDTLYHVYYHLYFNAFQPGSMMDEHSLNVPDPDPRVENRISKLKPEEFGSLEVLALSKDGVDVSYEMNGTILEVALEKPILPGKKVRFDMTFKGQVPVQIRRSGRDNKEGVAYSMAQWYPKMCEYDKMGWHADPYIGREFHGVWGDFDVTIHLDSAFTIGGTGVLQNPTEIGHGYTEPGEKLNRPAGNMLAWNFKAENVHDFMWGADPDYIHTSYKMKDGPMLHFFYKDQADLKAVWEQLPEYTARCFEYANTHYGEYPWPQYSVIQGGDGGMEYPMATLITGKRKLGSLVGVTVHEAMHCWYQSILASNEGLYSWMDEGFTTFASNQIMANLFDTDADIRRGSYYDSYIRLAQSGAEEPMSQMADHFLTFYAYGSTTYNKGAVFMAQLGYVLGNDVMMEGLLSYYNTWKFSHPDPWDVTRVMEYTSGTHLKWYLHYMLNTTAQIDYGIKSVEKNGKTTDVVLERIGDFPMPIDVNITYNDGSKEVVNIPLRIMRNAKAAEDATPYTVAEDWPWTRLEYTLNIDRKLKEISKIEIDETLRLADVVRKNNVIDLDLDKE